MGPEVIHLVDLRIEVGAQSAHGLVGEIEVLPVEREVDVAAGGIQDGEGPVAAGEGFEPELQAVAIAVVESLYAEGVLVDGNHLLVHDDVAGGFAHGAQVVAED